MTNLAKESVRSETMPLMTLIDAATVAQRALEKRLTHLKLSVAQARILALAYYAKEQITPSILAALLIQENHSVSGLLNRLEDRDLITRTRDVETGEWSGSALHPKGKRLPKKRSAWLLAFRKSLNLPSVALNPLRLLIRLPQFVTSASASPACVRKFEERALSASGASELTYLFLHYRGPGLGTHDERLRGWLPVHLDGQLKAVNQALSTIARKRRHDAVIVLRPDKPANLC